jgi:hypothetical protein
LLTAELKILDTHFAEAATLSRVNPLSEGSKAPPV